MPAKDNQRLLVVDDNMPGAEALMAMLALHGFDTRFATGGLSAVEMVGQWTPDIVVLDINMPEYDGFRTAQLMRRLLVTREAGLIAFTAQSEDDVHAKGVAAGFDAYAQKGYPEALLWAVRAILR